MLFSLIEFAGTTAVFGAACCVADLYVWSVERRRPTITYLEDITMSDITISDQLDTIESDMRARQSDVDVDVTEYDVLDFDPYEDWTDEDYGLWEDDNVILAGLMFDTPATDTVGWEESDWSDAPF